MMLMRQYYLNPCGLGRKGLATHAISGTIDTASSSLPSITRQGEWPLGAMLDVHWQFASICDHYSGRILAGLDPKHLSIFGILPPQWTNSNILEKVSLKEVW